MIPAGAVDCDIHLPVPGMGQLLPYLDDFWRDMVTSRGMDSSGPSSRRIAPCQGYLAASFDLVRGGRH